MRVRVRAMYTCIVVCRTQTNGYKTTVGKMTLYTGGGEPIHCRAHDIVDDDRAHARGSAAPGVVRVRCDTNEPVNLNVACQVGHIDKPMNAGNAEWPGDNDIACVHVAARKARMQRSGNQPLD